MELPLRDIHVPESVAEYASFPLGAFILILLFLILVALMIYFMKKEKSPSLKSQALKKLEGIKQQFEEGKDTTLCLAEISVFLRRTALSQSVEGFEGKQLASLSGRVWLEVLDAPLQSKAFSEGCGKILLQGPYQQSAENEEVEKLLDLCFLWTRAFLK